MKKIFILTGLLFCVSASWAITYVANSGVGTWTDATAWSPNGVPGAADDVVIPDGSTMRILGTSQSCNTLFLNCNYNFSSTNATFVMTGASTLSIAGDLTMDEDFAVVGVAIMNIASTSAVTVGGNINQNLFSTTGAKIYMSSGASTLNLAGSFTFPYGVSGTFTGGTLGSTVNFNGSSAQTVPSTEAAFVFCNLKSSNTNAASGLTIGAALTSSNFKGNLSTGSGAYFNDGGFGISCLGSVTNAGTYNASGSLTITSNFTNSGTFTSSGCNISLGGNWNNTGTYTYATGDAVTFNGSTSNQTIDGTTDWYDITFSNTYSSGTITFNSGSHTIRHVFDINSGAVTNSASLTFLSDASGTAQMADITGGSFTGSINMQRYFSKGAQNWVCIGTPLAGNTLNNLHDDGIAAGQEFILSGYTGADYTSSNWYGYNNTYSYNANNVVTVRADGWVAATNTTNAIGADNNFKGNFIYADATTYNVKVSGTPNTGSTAIPLAYLSTGTASEDGWNLITNPFPCTVDWESVRGGLSGVNDFYSVYTESGNFAYYEGGIGGTNGATRYIPVMQGFWVQSTGGTSITFAETDKAPTQDPTFLKSASTINQVMRIAINGSVNNFSDEVLVVAGDHYVNSFDHGDNDIIKWKSMDSLVAPNLATYSSDNIELAFNKINMNQSIDIPVTARPGDNAQGNYQLAFTIPTDFMNGACMTLEDVLTGSITNLRADTSYSFTSSLSDPETRFIIHINKGYDILSVEPTCSASADGSISISGGNINGHNFNLIDANGNVIATQTAANNSVVFDLISAGTYTINTDYVSACGQSTETVIVNQPSVLDASFTTNTNSIDIGNNDILEVTSNTSGLSYTWDFGDGNTSTGSFASHTYTNPGTYTVSLTVDNGNCSNTSTTSVTVTNSTTGIAENSDNNNVNAYITNEHLMVDLKLDQINSVSIKVINLSGQLITSLSNQQIQEGRIDVTSTSELAAGVYLVQVIGDNFNRTIKIPLR